MSITRHWIALLPIFGPVVCHSEEDATDFRGEDEWPVSGPFVPEDQLKAAIAEAAMLRRIVAATRDYLLLAPDDSIDYEALLTRVRSALGEQGTT